jgi:hypothetical protein
MASDRVLIKDLGWQNPWSGFGPTEPSPIVSLWASHAYFDQYLTGVAPNSYGAPGVFEGPIAGLFTAQFRFKQDCTVKEVRIYHGYWRQKTAPRSTMLAMGKGAQILDVWDLTDTPEQYHEAGIDTGGWFAFYSSQVANTHLFLNRGAPLILRANPYTWYWLELFVDTRNKPLKQGDTVEVELFAQTWPLDEAMTRAKSLADMVAYLEKPTGMELTRGKQAAGPGGLLELMPDNYAVGAVSATADDCPGWARAKYHNGTWFVGPGSERKLSRLGRWRRRYGVATTLGNPLIMRNAAPDRLLGPTGPGAHADMYRCNTGARLSCVDAGCLTPTG